jgi:ApaG protein
MSPATYREVTHGVEVKVTPEYLPAESSPKDARFIFAYHIEITNQGDEESQLMSRHWLITDGKGVVRDVKGPGVVGEQPRLAPGQTHRYSSYCELGTPTGNMRGTFRFEASKGREFDAKIPLFFLRDLRATHATPAPGASETLH